MSKARALIAHPNRSNAFLHKAEINKHGLLDVVWEDHVSGTRYQIPSFCRFCFGLTVLSMVFLRFFGRGSTSYPKTGGNRSNSFGLLLCGFPPGIELPTFDLIHLA